MEAIFFALIAFLGWGVADLFVTISARKLNAYTATFYSLLISFVLLSLLIPFMLKDLQNLTPQILGINIILGLILIFGVITFREALIIGSSPLIVIIANSYAAITTILSIIAFDEKLTLYQGLSIIVVFIGLVLSVINLKLLLKGRIHVGKGEILALSAMLSWGIYFAFIKIPVKEIGWFWPNYFSFVFFIPLVFWFIKLKKINLYAINHNKSFLPLLLGVVFAKGAELSFNLGISKGYSSVVAPISGASPMLFVILAAIFLKDSLTKQQIFGIVTTLVGIILLSILSV